MGEVAEMMLDGTLCERCGTYIEGDAPGHPRYCCNKCQFERLGKPVPVAKIPCEICKRRVKRTGMKDHLRDAHGVKP